MVAGEAAHLLLNAGKAIQGMDFAMRSGMLAAETAIHAAESGDASKRTLSNYRKALDASYVMQDMRSFQDAVHLLHSPAMHQKVPAVVCDFGRQFFTVRNEPTPKASQMMRTAVKRHASYWELIKLGAKAARAL